ncbi:beta-ketoacyl synthase N-terminal-like domain-containing protein [Desulfoluna sp.]|uniref:beta-ketoacyl synthase N-terminal-like domain-containing protein n=1 Tax=Desulfoluna sp. TaxID=2045199 RepID=UPI002638309A|nr:beta-ketoacyl synthase N-terminal-like domain-containing protein [Desulfoluna sp.]
MNLDQEIAIVQCGARTPVGTSAAMTAAMVRAEVTRLLRHPYFEDDQGKPLVMGRASYVGEEYEGADRFIALAIPALEEALRPLKGIPHQKLPLPVVIGVPEIRPGFSFDFIEVIQDSVTDALNHSETLETDVTMIPAGHAAGLMAFKEAAVSIREGRCEFAVFGGIDSFDSAATLSWLNACNRLKTSNNRFGFIPGEGAGFCLIASTEIISRYGLTGAATVRAESTTEEAHPIGKGTVCTGPGLSAAFADVLHYLPENKQVSRVLCDMNGERYRTDEYGFAALRHSHRFESASNLVAPVNRWGDMGAATAPNLINLAIESGNNGYTGGPFQLIWTSSDSGKRSALLLELLAN